MTRREALSRTVLLCRDFIAENEAADDELVEALSTATVAIVADAANLRTAASQAATVALAGQVLGYGCRLRLVMPDVELVGYQPPLRSGRLRSGLLDFAQDLIPDAQSFASDNAVDDDFVFVIGSTEWRTGRDRAWRLGGTRWTGVLVEAASSVPVWNDGFPIGALVAATMAAAEPFKAIVSDLLTRKNIARTYDELRPARTATVRLGDEDVALESVDAGEIDIVSGGAITNAALHALLRVPNMKANARVFEPEKLDVSNLNRYALARRSRVHAAKIDMIGEWQRDGFAIRGVPQRFDERSLAAYLPLATTIIMGTDDIPSRWFVQQQRPSWLSVGATIHFTVVVSEHGRGEACAGCLHPEDDDVNVPIATVSFVSYWAGLWLAARLLHHLAGKRMTTERQTVEVAALRLDSRRGIWFHPVRRNSRCPVKCGEQDS